MLTVKHELWFTTCDPTQTTGHKPCQHQYLQYLFEERLKK